MNIQNSILAYLRTHGSVNIVIAGSSCSGKTTMAKDIFTKFSPKYSVTVITQDDYFKDLKDIPRTRDGYLTDSLYAFHSEEFKQDVKTLLIDGSTLVPSYDITTNSRVCKEKIAYAGRINIFEGLHTIELLKDLPYCVKVFLDTNIDTCLHRRIERDTSKFGVPEQRIREHWNLCIRPMYETFILPQKQLADIIIN